MIIKDNFKEYILELANTGLRHDGRKGLLTLRSPITIEYGVSKNAEGSALVRWGETEVWVGVKLDVGEPFPDSADEGILIVNAELTPVSSSEFEPGPPDENSIELARIVDRGIRESKMIDMKKLCIKEGEKVWMVMIDIYPKNAAGNLIDAAMLGAVAALSQTKFPKFDGERVDYHEHTDKSLPIVKKPLSCTIGFIGGKMFVDMTKDEEKVADARLTVTLDENGNIHAMQKGGVEGLSAEEIIKAVEVALEKTKELRNMVNW